MLKHYKLYLLLSLIFITILSCQREKGKLDVAKASDLIRGDTNLTIIDVRTSGEYLLENIDGSINIDVLSANFSSRIGMLEKTNSYFLYSQNPIRVETALQMMTNLGFSNVYILNGNYKDLLNLLLTDENI